MLLHNSKGRNHSILWYYFQLMISPAHTIHRIVEEKVSLKSIVLVLIVIGFLRGVVEGVWIYGMKGKWPLLIESLQHWDWYKVNTLPFIICNIPSAHFLWLGLSFCLFATGKLLGTEGRFSDVARVMGIAMINYITIGLLNYLYLFIKLPALTLYATDTYSPQIGIGQLIVLGWLVYIMYLIGRFVMNLGVKGSVLIAPLPIALSLVSFALSAVAFFKLIEFFLEPSRWETFVIANYAYTLVIIIFIPIFWFLGLGVQKWLRGWSITVSKR